MPTEPANTVETRLATLAAMLRLLSADQPFQPILAASVDLTAWQAIFTNECIHLLDDAKRQAVPPETLKPFEELRDFTAELFAAAYFARFQADDYPDREPGELLLDDDCPRTSAYLKATTPDTAPALEKRDLATNAKQLGSARAHYPIKGRFP